MKGEIVSRSCVGADESGLAAFVRACPGDVVPVVNGKIEMIGSGWRSHIDQAPARDRYVAPREQGLSGKVSAIRN